MMNIPNKFQIESSHPYLGGWATAACLGLALLATGAGAAERTWTDGAGDGLWSSAANWSDSTLPAAGDTVVFSGTPRTVTLSANTPALAGVTFSGSGTWTLDGIINSTRSASTYYLCLQGSEPVLSVAEGTVALVKAQVGPTSHNATDLNVTGAGEITFYGYMYYHASLLFRNIDLAIAKCTFSWKDHSDGVSIAKSADSYIDIRADAKVYITAMNMTCNWGRYRVEEGGLLDLGGKQDSIGGFCGAGVVTNAAQLTVSPAYPATFSGRLYGASKSGSGTVTPSGAVNFYAYWATYPQVIGSTDALAHADVGFGSVTNKAGEVVIPLQFAPDVGTYRVRDILYDKGVWTNYPFALQDTEGNAITLELTPGYDRRPTFRYTGPGSLRYVSEGTSCRVLVDTDHSFTGNFEVQKSFVRIGAVNPQTRLVTPLCYKLEDGAEIHDEGTCSDFVYPTVIGGLLQIQNALADAVRTVTATSCLNTTVNLAAATAGTRLTLRDGLTTNTVFDIRKNGVLEIGEGARVANCYMKTADGGGTAQIVLSGGVSTNLYWTQPDRPYSGTTYYYTGGTAAKPPKPTLITGGTHFLSGLYGDYYNSYIQTGGHVTTAFTCTQGNAGQTNIYYRISGGTLRIDGTLIPGTFYPRGFGIEATGAGTKVSIRDNSNLKTRIASDGDSHTWRVSDGAEIEIEADSVIFGTGNTSVTGLVEVLEGGTLTLHSAVSNPDPFAWLRMDGGTVRFASSFTATATDDTYWWTVGAKGARFVSDVGSGNSFGLQPALKPDPTLATGTCDGGLDVTVASGIFSFTAKSVNTYHGPTAIHGNKVAFSSGATLAGPVHFDRTAVSFVTAGAYALATDTGAKLTFSPGTHARFSYDASTLTAGASDGVADLARTNRGVLFLTRVNNTSVIGSSETFRLKLADAPACVNGLATVPVVAIHPSPTDSTCRTVDLLGYETANGFVTASYRAGLADATSADVVLQDDPVTLTADVHAHALKFQPTSGDASAQLDLGGYTLTLGDGSAPALLSLNNHNTVGAAVVTNGTLAFGASEGIVVASYTQSALDYSPAVISAAITGTGGLTLAPAPDADSQFGALRLAAANAYTGGTEVHGIVFADSCAAFGTGAVAVRRGSRDGCVCLTASGTVANDFTLAGDGAGYCVQSGDYAKLGPAALCSLGGNTFTGTVTLDGDAGVCASTGFNEMVFAGQVTGGGALKVVRQYVVGSTFSARPVVLTAANDYTGGTVVSNGATLIVRGSGTLGTGPVRVDGRLDVEVSSARTFGALSGSGTVRLLGSGTVTFASTADFTGTIERAGGTYDLNGADAATTLKGDTSWTNGGAPATLTSENAASAVWNGTLGTGVNLLKTGAGDLNVTAEGALAGTVTVREGTLRLGGGERVAPIDDSLQFRLDASAAASIVTNAEGYVTAWSDADGNGRIFLADGTHDSPQVTGETINGLPALWFEGTNHTRLVCSTKNWSSIKQVFVVFNRAATQPHYANGWLCAGVLGWSGQDKGLRFTSGTWGSGSDANSWPGYGKFRVNGADGNKITSLQTDVHDIRFETVKSSSSYSLALGDYWGNVNHNRVFRGYFCEILAYGRELTTYEMEATEGYLMRKWQQPLSATPAVFASDASVTVEDGATLDLNGATLTLADLTGAGTVTNTSATASRVTLAGGGTVSHLTMDLEGNIVLWLGGGTLDLGGETVHVHQVRGSGTIVNGTLTADIDRRRRGLAIILK